MYYFPFGQTLTKVEQKDRSPKSAFVLGVYASAVHAAWSDKFGNQKVAALAVASEPEIFWTGKNADEIISSISLPKELGRLTIPRNHALNGPSGKALDTLYLSPLGLNRGNTWLCDLLPESRVNPSQRHAIKAHYTDDIVTQYHLKPATIPDFKLSDLDSVKRRGEIASEMETSKANVLILLGDLPIRWFLNFFDSRYSKLSQFGITDDTYGCSHRITIRNNDYNVIPLCHPRQAAKLGNSNSVWGKLHDSWIRKCNQRSIESLFFHK